MWNLLLKTSINEVFWIDIFLKYFSYRWQLLMIQWPVRAYLTTQKMKFYLKDVYWRKSLMEIFNFFAISEIIYFKMCKSYVLLWPFSSFFFFFFFWIFTRNPIFTIEPSLASGAKLPPLYFILERELPTIYHLTDFESCLLESLLNFAFFIKSFCANRLM